MLQGIRLQEQADRQSPNSKRLKIFSCPAPVGSRCAVTQGPRCAPSSQGKQPPVSPSGFQVAPSQLRSSPRTGLLQEQACLL